MDTINPWIDPTLVRQLAEKLIRPVEQTPIVTNDPGYDTSFVGFVDSDELAEEMVPVIYQPATQPATLPAASVVASVTGVFIQAPQPVVKITPAAPATTLLDSQFQNFRNWLTQYFDSKEIFILDHAGSILFDESHHGRLHFIARDLILQAGQPHNVRVKFGPSANLELIPCETSQGLMILGALFPNSLPNEHIANIRDALSQSLSA
jgi:hypothetical protein